MDGQELPDNSSEEISKDKNRDGDDKAPAPSDTESPASESAGEQDDGSSKSRANTDDIAAGLPPEELPTMQWSDVYAELTEFENLETDGIQEDPMSGSGQKQPDPTGPLDGLEDAMNWLEQLAEGQGMPIDEMPTLVTAQPVPDDQPREEETSDDPPDTDIVVPTLELDSDPMAWLEQLAVDQSSPLEELPSVADRLLASEIASQTEIPPNSTINDPYDVDQALSYLEQLAVTQGVDLAGVSFDSEQPIDSLNAALSILDGLALTGLAANAASRLVTSADEKDLPALVTEDGDPEDLAATELRSDLSTDMPDDPHLALDWLSNIDEESGDESMEIITEADTADLPKETSDTDSSTAESGGEVLAKASDESKLDSEALEEMPEDPDEAIAWMEHLAAGDSQRSTAESGVPAIQEEPQTAPASSSTLARPETLEAAQTALDNDDLDKALSIYQGVLDEGYELDELVGALEDAVEHREDSPRLLRLLGDAYMQNGEVDKAIATYRKGFDHL